MILRNNARHPDHPKPLPEWITESQGNYATLKRHLPETKTDHRMYVYYMYYRSDPWEELEMYDTNSSSFKIHVENPPKTDEETMEFPQPPSQILKKTEVPTTNTRSNRVHHN